jgi:hypothetical protein
LGRWGAPLLAECNMRDTIQPHLLKLLLVETAILRLPRSPSSCVPAARPSPLPRRERRSMLG